MLQNNTQKNSILFLTPRFPYPLIGGDRIKSFYLLKHLAKTYNVTLVTYSHGKAPSSDRLKPLLSMGIEVHSITLNPVINGLHSLRTLWTSLPLEIAFYHDSQFQNKVNELIAEREYLCAISFFMRTAECIRKLPIKKILIAEDCRLLYQTRSTEVSSNIIQKAVRAWEVFKLKTYEKELMSDFDTITLVTTRDIEEMKKGNPSANYQLLTNGIDLDAMPASNVDQLRNRRGLLFAGVLQLWANAMMAITIVRDILPIVHSEFPEEELTIVGSNPGSSIISLQSRFVHLFADVPSIEEYFYSSAIFIHPHKGASGIQNKVLQALAMGCVVVTTPTGIQGIPAEHGKHVLIGNSSQEIAEHVIFLLKNPEKRIELAQHGRTLIEEHFSWDAIYKSMDSILESTLFT